MENGDQFDQEAVERLPNGAKLSWGLGKQPKRGPKGELSVAQIVETAVGIADREGIAAVSMSRVAGALGFTTMSLYRYIASKDDLLLLMQDAVCNIPLPPQPEQEDWRQEMKDFVRGNIQVFRDHPWYGDIPIASIPITPHILQFVEWGLRTMRTFPLNHYEKMSFVLLLSGYARACGLIERDVATEIRKGGSADRFSGLPYTAALQQLVKAERYPHLYPLVMSGAYTDDPADENPIGNDLDFGLERILDGIQQYVALKNAIPNHSSGE